MRDRCQPRATVFKSLSYSIPFFPFVGRYKQSFPFLQLQAPNSQLPFNSNLVPLARSLSLDPEVFLGEWRFERRCISELDLYLANASQLDCKALDFAGKKQRHK
ncbi:hypothetical protein ACE6H2_012124 [Prunus campanulata]